MLMEVYKSDPLYYYNNADPNPHVPLWDDFYNSDTIPEPYDEQLALLDGIIVSPSAPPGPQHVPQPPGQGQLPTSPTSIYVFGMMNQKAWPSWGFAYWRFNAVTGKMEDRIPTQSNLGALFAMNGVSMGRQGDLYSRHYYQDEILKLHLGTTATAFLGEEPELSEEDREDGVVSGWHVEEGWTASHFSDHGGEYGPVRTFGFGAFAVDLQTDTFLNSFIDDAIHIYTLSTGQWKYSVRMPDIVDRICLEDASRVYILLMDRQIILFDYIRNEVLGVAKLPRPVEAREYWNTSDIEITWDPVFRRLLVIEKVPDINGASDTRIRGYRMVPEAVRVTVPIPLLAPRQRRAVPFLVQCVGDLNEGVGGYVVDATVTGSGSQIGIPISDNHGNTRIMVACEGHESFSASPPFDWANTGSPDADPPHTGLINIAVEAWSYRPDPADIPVTGGATGGGSSGHGGGPGPGGDWPPGTPAPPSEGHDPGTGASAQAPNMTYILERVLNAGNWQMTRGDAYDQQAADGRGAYTEAAVTAMHDVDARFGHVDKNPGQNQYNGHAVDAINFKRDDGTMAEIYDIISGSGGIGWGLAHGGISAANLAKWKYPA